MFLSRNKKNNVYPCKPQFYYIKVGFKGLKIIYACFRDGITILRNGLQFYVSLKRRQSHILKAYLIEFSHMSTSHAGLPERKAQSGEPERNVGLYTPEPYHEKTYLLTCALNEDSNQLAHERNLIRVFVVRMNKLHIPGYPKCARRRF